LITLKPKTVNKFMKNCFSVIAQILIEFYTWINFNSNVVL